MEVALSRLRNMIIDGTLAPGEQIRQQEMAEQFGVSRVPLREALNVLADQGLLQHRPHSGYFVVKRTPSEVDQIRRMLEYLEGDLMSSVEWPTQATLVELRRMNDRMRDCVARHEWSALFLLNREFHLRIFDLSPDRLVLQETQRLWNLADPQIAMRISSPEAAERTVVEHEAILVALARHDRAGCRTAMDHHRNSSVPVRSPRLEISLKNSSNAKRQTTTVRR